MTSNDNTPSGCIKKLLDNLGWHRANYQTPQHVEPMFPVTKSLMGSLIPVLQDALSENAKMKSELQEANTKLTMYEARHENDQHEIEQLERKRTELAIGLSELVQLGEIDPYRNPDDAYYQYRSLIKDLKRYISQLQQ